MKLAWGKAGEISEQAVRILAIERVSAGFCPWQFETPGLVHSQSLVSSASSPLIVKVTLVTEQAQWRSRAHSDFLFFALWVPSALGGVSHT